MRRFSPVCVFLLLACDGLISTATPPSVKPTVPPEQQPCSEGGTEALLPPRIRRLTPSEYSATLAALGSTAPSTSLFPKDPAPHGYSNRAGSLRVSPPLVQSLWNEAPALARSMGTGTCTTEACARTFLSTTAAKAYRRPLSTEELDELITVVRAGDSIPEGIQLALEVILQSPDLLFHTELGAGTLTPYETANLLAYSITGAPPDEQLTALAAKGPLDAETRATEARRLLDAQRAHEVVGDFAAQWLEVANLETTERDPDAYPSWPAQRAPALQETRSSVANAVLDGHADLAGLFTLPGTSPERRGILTQTAVLAAHAQRLDSSPIRRGHLVRMRLLCQFKTLAPPANLNISLPPADPNATTRQRFAAHSSNATCASCHQYIDPLGFAFEGFDAAGAHRTTDNGQSVDTTGTLTGTDVDAPFSGAFELQALLGQSSIARDCLTQHWFEFSLAQSVDELPAATTCRLRNATRGFTAGNVPIRELVVELVKSDLFVTRSP